MNWKRRRPLAQEPEPQRKGKRRRLVRSWITSNLNVAGGLLGALYTDLALDILSRLSGADIILRVARVCKTWCSLAHSQDLRQLSHLRTVDNPHLGGAQPWMVLERADNKLLFYPSPAAVLSKQGKPVDERSFSGSSGPPGRKFAFLGYFMGLVCGRLVDEPYQTEDGYDINLAVGNPLTNQWRILPRLAVESVPVGYRMKLLEKDSAVGHYVVEIECKGSRFTHNYNSRSQAWEVWRWDKDVGRRMGSYCSGKTEFRIPVTYLFVENMHFVCRRNALYVCANHRRTEVMEEGSVNRIVTAFLPSLAVP